MKRREKLKYFKRIKDAPESLDVYIKRCVSFSEVDIMGIVWYGRYPVYFEEGAAALGRRCGLSYKDFYEANLRAPIAQFHIDYYQPLTLDEEFTIKTSLIWDEAARLNTEYELIKQNGNAAARGYTVQMFVDGISREVCLVSPELLQRCRRRWKAGEFTCLK